MTAETNLQALIKGMSPKLNSGDYVFFSVDSPDEIDIKYIICMFRETEGTTLILIKLSR